MKICPPSPEGVAEAVAALREGEIVAYPTETVYGLAVDPFNEDALASLYAAKGRADAHPVLMIIAELAQAEAVAARIEDHVRPYMDQFWPGPLSLLLPARAGLPAALTAGSGKVCLRCSAHPVARALAAAFGGPITSTSANRSGAAPATSLETLDVPGIAITLDGGTLEENRPSTVFDPETGAVLRAGAITAAQLAGLPLRVR